MPPAWSKIRGAVRGATRRLRNSHIGARARIAARYSWARLSSGPATEQSQRPIAYERLPGLLPQAVATPALSLPGSPRTFPKIIWMYWAQGWDEAPVRCAQSRAAWTSLNPGYAMVSLDDANVPSFLEPLSWELNPLLTVQARSNILRMRLLATYGGVWVDTTTLPTRPLDDWLPLLMQSGYFAFSKPGSDRMIATWFMAACAPCPLLEAWLCAYEIYFRTARAYDIYFVLHYLFGALYLSSPELRAQWDDTPKVSADGAHAVHTHFVGTAAEGEAASTLVAGAFPLHKLNWRTPVSDEVWNALLAAALRHAPMAGNPPLTTPTR